MEKERRIKTLSLVALIVAVLGLTIAFAALSQTLTINGTASINSATWDIHFENLARNTNGDATINGEPTLNATTISGINVTLTKPNDSVIFLVDIVNDGTIDAKVESIEVSELCTLSSPVESCDWDNDGEVTETDIQKVNDNLTFVAGYNDDSTSIKVNDTLNIGETKKIAIAIAYYKLIEGDTIESEEATELPARDLQFNDLSVTINYVQAD